jgi:hypothetical protein
MWQRVHFVQNELKFPSVYVIKYQPYDAISPGFCLESKKHGVREIVVSAPWGQPGKIDFEAMSRKNYLQCGIFYFIGIKVVCHNYSNFYSRNRKNYRQDE